MQPRRLMPFVIFQLVFVVVVVGWAGYRLREERNMHRLPPLRSEPLVVEPMYNHDVVVTDEQLVRVLRKLALRNNGAQTHINHIDHALRFWGLRATFTDPEMLSGDEMRSVLIDHQRFTQMYGAEMPPLLLDEGRGVRVRENDGIASSSHDDHTLAGLAEVGTSLDHPVVTAERLTSFRALAEQSLRDFSLNQPEYEWSVLAYALMLPPHTEWVTAENQKVNFDRMARRIMRQQMPQGVCYGNHRLYTLVILLRVNEELPILSHERRREIIQYLQSMTSLLVKHQHADGFWNARWPSETASSSQPTEEREDRLSARIIATGHALEWWAMAPREVHPPRHVLAAAGQWIVRTVDDMTPEDVMDHFTFLSHAGRALALWRGRWPADVIRESASLELSRKEITGS